MGPPRSLAGLASVSLVAVLVLVTLLPDCASACSCAAPSGTPRQLARGALSGSTAVFSGEVVAVEEQPLTGMVEGTVLYGEGGPTIVSLRISEVWKGPERTTLEVGTSGSESSCGYPFRPGERYLVYAEEGMTVGLCGATKPLSEAGTDLGALGTGARPKDGGSLADTSGGVPTRTMAGLAVLTMAASFLLFSRLTRTR